jgi:hypothetical protein
MQSWACMRGSQHNNSRSNKLQLMDQLISMLVGTTRYLKKQQPEEAHNK